MVARQNPAPDFVPTRAVARMIGISVNLFRIKREAMIEDLGFPEPLPHSSSPLLWRRDQVEAWVEGHGRPRAEPPPTRPIGPNVVLMEEARRA